MGLALGHWRSQALFETKPGRSGMGEKRQRTNPLSREGCGSTVSPIGTSKPLPAFAALDHHCSHRASVIGTEASLTQGNTLGIWFRDFARERCDEY